ncbi:UNVERIFIED_CONTAM: hypothetical protein Sangu_1123800 [Sesamum angustifolium]|uniref:Pentatricopeptide repeat-containing protein n=1 Tax=Sesamum angustifolium TaxID=2727405 RepID=A0AAW2NYJ8_9LAMI
MRQPPSVVDFTKLLGAVVMMKAAASSKVDMNLNVTTFTILIKGLFLEHKQLEIQCQSLYQIIHSLCKDRTVEDALQIFFKLTEKGISPNFPTYSSRIQGLCSCSRWKEEYLLHEMAAQKISLDVFTFSILIDAYYEEGMVEEAEDVLKIMMQVDVRPNIITYSALIDDIVCEDKWIKPSKYLILLWLRP